MARKKKPTIKKTFEFEATLFDLGNSDREQSIKVVEEAAEVFSAVQEWERTNDMDAIEKKFEILDESADVITAILNLLHKLDFDEYDLLDAMDRCSEKNMKKLG